jgi:hypothetical protein
MNNLHLNLNLIGHHLSLNGIGNENGNTKISHNKHAKRHSINNPFSVSKEQNTVEVEEKNDVNNTSEKKFRFHIEIPSSVELSPRDNPRPPTPLRDREHEERTTIRFTKSPEIMSSDVVLKASKIFKYHRKEKTITLKMVFDKVEARINKFLEENKATLCPERTLHNASDIFDHIRKDHEIMDLFFTDAKELMAQLVPTSNNAGIEAFFPLFKRVFSERKNREITRVYLIFFSPLKDQKNVSLLIQYFSMLMQPQIERPLKWYEKEGKTYAFPELKLSDSRGEHFTSLNNIPLIDLVRCLTIEKFHFINTQGEKSINLASHTQDPASYLREFVGMLYDCGYHSSKSSVEFQIELLLILHDLIFREKVPSSEEFDKKMMERINKSLKHDVVQSFGEISKLIKDLRELKNYSEIKLDDDASEKERLDKKNKILGQVKYILQLYPIPFYPVLCALNVTAFRINDSLFKTEFEGLYNDYLTLVLSLNHAVINLTDNQMFSVTVQQTVGIHSKDRSRLIGKFIREMKFQRLKEWDASELPSFKKKKIKFRPWDGSVVAKMPEFTHDALPGEICHIMHEYTSRKITSLINEVR